MILHCLYCGCDISSLTDREGHMFWVDTRGSSLCPSWQATFHGPHPADIPDRPPTVEAER